MGINGWPLRDRYTEGGKEEGREPAGALRPTYVDVRHGTARHGTAAVPPMRPCDAR